MTATTGTVYDVRQNDKVTTLWVETAACSTGNTLTVDLTDYGATKIKGILGFVETTESSVVVQEQPTTAVASGTLTITVGGSTVTGKKRNYMILCN